MLKVLFTCDLCGLVDEPAEVRYRRDGEDVAHYVEHVIADAVQMRHQIKSWGCPAEKITQVKIPIGSGEKGIGYPP